MSDEGRRTEDGHQVNRRELKFELDPLTSWGGTLCTKPVEIFEGESVSIGAVAWNAETPANRNFGVAGFDLNLEQSKNQIDWGNTGFSPRLVEGHEIHLEEPTPQKWIRLRLRPRTLEAGDLGTGVWGAAWRIS